MDVCLKMRTKLGQKRCRNCQIWQFHFGQIQQHNNDTTLTLHLLFIVTSYTMAPREPTRAQLSSKLAYQQHTPNFLLKLQNRINGIPDEEELEDKDDDGEFEYVGSGRPPIPKRPAIPERPKDDPGSADEDDGDEKPQVVVLKAGKHLTEREAENVRRKGQ